MREQHVALLDERVGVKRDRGHLEPAFERPLVQRLDVAEHVLELEAARVHRPVGQGPEHERVVGVGAVAEADQHKGGRLAGRGQRRPKNQRSSGPSTSARRNGWRRAGRPSCSETRTSSSSAVVRSVERVLELVALERVVAGPRLVARPVLRVDGATDRPDAALLALDPDHDPLG